MEEEKFDVAIVGAGPAGLAAAYVLAQAGLQVVVFERGEYPGSKNVMGGILYRQPTEAVFPGFWKEAPLERPIVEQRIWVLTKQSAITLGYKSERLAQEPYNCFSVLRAKFDRWLAGKVEEAGAFILTETVVEGLLRENGKVVGVRTGREDGDVRADVVIAADGVNSLIARDAGLHAELKPEHVALTVKEIIALPKEKIEDRFNLEQGQGAAIELVGEATGRMLGTAFIYTNQDSLSVGVGAIAADFVSSAIKPYELIEQLKNHPAVRPLLAGGETKEYMAHLIPEGGYKAIPKLYADGLLVVGDAAMLVNSLHREGSNLALTSGSLAAQAIIKAREKGDFSAQSLSVYQRLLEESFVIKDLKKYRNATHYLEAHRELFTLYPELMDEAAYDMMVVDSIPKGDKQKMIFKRVRSRRPLLRLAKDLFDGWRAIS
ncbi:MAG: FAD-dependent oxidoreductase [Dehalococcoidia bacterium]|nr:FAD-dependent oxidoreductase [Dehalococcoidia bacterium]